MKIGDLEKLLGIKRSNIFYYEREGLLEPYREDNNYREYSEDDLRRLKTIVVLRKLGFTVAEIRALLAGERTLSDVLPENMERLSAQTEELDEAMAFCRELERRGVTMEDFDADAWFEAMESEERQGRRFLDLVGDAAEDVSRTMAFMQDSIGLHGPVWAMFFLSEEGIKKRRLWKFNWIQIALMCLWFFAGLPLISGVRPARPGAALAFILLEGVVLSLVLLFCARYVIPGRKPRQAFWLTIACYSFVTLLFTLVGQPVLELEFTDGAKERAVGRLLMENDAAIEDPAAYVRSKYGSEDMALDIWEHDDVMYVFAPWGVPFEFRRLEDGTWLEIVGIGSPASDGILYTVDPYGPEPYPSRLMLADGTVVMPVYEAHLSTGYVPVFAFDVSGGETYSGLLFGVDEGGGLHYSLRTKYYLRTEGADYNEPDLFKSYTAAKVYRTADGPAFFEAWKELRSTAWSTAPTAEADRAYMGVESSYLIYAEHIAPPSLVVDADAVIPDEWGLNEYNEIMYPQDDGARYIWSRVCHADVTALLYADEVTPALLHAAAQSARSAAETDGRGPNAALYTDYSPAYSQTRVWDGVTGAEALLSLSYAVRRELG